MWWKTIKGLAQTSLKLAQEIPLFRSELTEFRELLKKHEIAAATFEAYRKQTELQREQIQLLMESQAAVKRLLTDQIDSEKAKTQTVMHTAVQILERQNKRISQLEQEKQELQQKQEAEQAASKKMFLDTLDLGQLKSTSIPKAIPEL